MFTILLPSIILNNLPAHLHGHASSIPTHPNHVLFTTTNRIHMLECLDIYASRLNAFINAHKRMCDFSAVDFFRSYQWPSSSSSHLQTKKYSNDVPIENQLENNIIINEIMINESMHHLKNDFNTFSVDDLKQSLNGTTTQHVDDLKVNDETMPCQGEMLFDGEWGDYFRTFFESMTRDQFNAFLLKLARNGELPTHDPIQHYQTPKSLTEFTQNAQRLPLPSEEIDLSFIATAHKKTDIEVNDLLKVGMTPKKQYEVKRFGDLVSCFLQPSFPLSSPMMQKSVHENTRSIVDNETTTVIDVGSGQGYLPSHLVSSFPVRIVGLDCDDIQTCGASKRQSKLNDSRWVSCTGFITPTTHLRSFVPSEYFETKRANRAERESEDEVVNKGYWLIGLHTCGNLSPTMLQLFSNDPDATILMNVGCCYNLLTLPNSSSCSSSPPSSSPWPMSRTLLSHSPALTSLSRALKTLACQAPDTWTPSTCTSSFHRHYFRSVLQVILARYLPHSTLEVLSIGKLRPRKFQSFVTYVRACLDRLTGEEGKERYQVDHVGVDRMRKLRDDELNAFLEKFDAMYGWEMVATTWTLRAMMAGVIESLILVDRFMYVVEQENVKEAWLVPLFQKDTSPRNQVIFARKS